MRPTSNTTNEKVSSTISGRFVAVPTNGGLPQTQIIIEQTVESLNIRLTNTVGEQLPNTPIQLEIDTAASAALYETTLTPPERLALLERQQITTDADGAATATIRRAGIPTGKGVVIMVRAAGSTSRIAVSEVFA